MFNFSFQIGSQDCARVHNKTQINPDNELSLLNSRASSAATERTGLVTTLDRTSDGAYQAPQIVSEASESITTGETNVISCGRLCVLPRELRIIIFKMLLVSDEPIKDAHQLVNIKEGLVASKVPRVPGIDARLLRTCRKVYEVRHSFTILLLLRDTHLHSAA